MKEPKIVFKENQIHLTMPNGDKAQHPLAWFPKLENASEKERLDFQFSPFGIHWPNLDEDLSFEGFFNFQKTTDLHQKLK